MLVDIQRLKEHLSKWIDPFLKADFVSSGCLKNIECINDKVVITLQLGFPKKNYDAIIKEALTKHFETIGVDLDLRITTQITAHRTQKNIPTVKNIKNIIAVASGKGGVGKSTTAINLALALHQEGASVGILDADIYGPNQPEMLGIRKKPEVNQDQKFIPIGQHGIVSMSIGYLFDAAQPTIWRGPMVSQALQQMLNETAWPELDYLIVDLPPGTGDAQLTLAQKIPVSGAVIVSTPQSIALADARKAIAMFRKLEISILGVVENMSYHVCSQCGHRDELFSHGGAESLAEHYTTRFLGAIPLETQIRECADDGYPVVIAHPDSPVSKTYINIARCVSAELSLKPRNYSDVLPRVVVE